MPSTRQPRTGSSRIRPLAAVPHQAGCTPSNPAGGDQLEYQVILLPKRNYWSWVRACKEYVLAFGAYMTPEPSTAAKYMAPRQVVTVPLVEGGYPDVGDIQGWFQAHHPEVQLDPIEVKSAAQLEDVFRKRIQDLDRYGQKQRPFHLLWPTDYPVITQKFGANPQIYSRFGLPGHEGLDLRALTNTNVYCCADGVVYQVQTNPKVHPYGIHVRIRHRDGFRTVYGHLARALVSSGEQVNAGQVIGKADSTGSSSASHLHLSLKRDYATERGETPYPKDIIDPTPYMVWPQGLVSKSLDVFEWPAGRCLIGVHGRVGGNLDALDLKAISTARLEAVKLPSSETKETLDRLREINPGMFFMVRLVADFSQAPVEAERFVAQVENDMGRFYRYGVRHFEVHANPNLQIEGWGRSWGNGREFGAWFGEVVRRLRLSFPEARLGFPGLSPGSFIPGQRADASQFAEDSAEAATQADWIGVNCYWVDTAGMTSLFGGRSYELDRLRFPDKMLFVTEFGNPSTSIAEREKGRQYLDFYRRLRDRPGFGAAFSFLLSAESGYQALVWSRGAGDGIVDALKGRNF